MLESGPKKNAVKAWLTQERLRELLDYDPATGEFRWRPRQVTHFRIKTWNARNAGKRAGRLTAHGYRHIVIEAVPFYAHQLAWLWVHGVWPGGHLDHRNGNRDDNWIDNLRAATSGQNNWNRRVQSRTRSGLKGAHWSKREKKWQSTISCNGKMKFLGYFPTAEAASEAYHREAEKLHGAYYRDDRDQTDSETE
jgi:hypothetical protein